MSGYPISKVYQNSQGPNDKTLALGLVAATPTYLRFEGVRMELDRNLPASPVVADPFDPGPDRLDLPAALQLFPFRETCHG